MFCVSTDESAESQLTLENQTKTFRDKVSVTELRCGGLMKFLVGLCFSISTMSLLNPVLHGCSQLIQSVVLRRVATYRGLPLSEAAECSSELVFETYALVSLHPKILVFRIGSSFRKY